MDVIHRADGAGRRAVMQDPDKVASTYNAVARQYAEAFCNEHSYKPLDRRMLEAFSRMIAGRTPVWDVGCGPGHTADYLRHLGVDASGLDISEGLLEQGRMRYPGILFRQGNLLDLDFDDGSIAGITAFYAIVHFSESQVEKAFEELYRVLQPGGQLLLTFHIGEETISLQEFLGEVIVIDFMFFRTDFILESLERTGFEQIEVVERDPYPDVEYQSRRAYVFSAKPAAG